MAKEELVDKNIVILLLDCARSDRFSLYGYERKTTKNIDDFAKDCFVYRNAFANGPWTLPSHGSIFTGLYPKEHGAGFGGVGIDPSKKVLAELLKNYGYNTVCITQNEWINQQTGLARGFDVYISPKNLKNRARHFLPKKSLTEVTVDMMFEIIEKIKRPFFIFVNFMDCHLPYSPPLKERMKFLRTPIKIWEAHQAKLDIMERRYMYLANGKGISEKEFELLRDLYDGALSHLDTQIGRIFDFFEEKGLSSLTSFLITSDHGENIGDHNLFDHHLSVHDTLLSVPLIVKDEKLGRGESEELFELKDIFHLVLWLIEKRDKPEKKDFILFEYELPKGVQRRIAKYKSDFPKDLIIRGVRNKRFKYVEKEVCGKLNSFLYDLEKDPKELRNLDDPTIADKMREKLKNKMDEIGSCESHIEEDEIFGEVRKRLESLGYL